MPLNIEYQTYDNASFSISQKGRRNLIFKVMEELLINLLRFLNEKGEMHSVRSLSLVQSTIREDNEEEYIQFKLYF